MSYGRKVERDIRREAIRPRTLMYETPAEIDAFFQCLFQQFRPVKKLGEGGFGIAILVFDTVEKVQKVFKLPKDERTTEALRAEGDHLVKLQELLHPNIIRLHQYGLVRMRWNDAEQERYYLNMAFGGTSLRAQLGSLRTELDENGNPQWFGSGRRLALDHAVRIAVDVCKGLEAAHGFRGAPVRMLHRDIKPDNILIDDKTGVARLSDFGISRVIERTSVGVSMAGTYPYMDPECFQGRATIQSDLYSLGIVLFELVTGDLPFRDFRQRFEATPPPPTQIVSNLPREVDEIVLRALSPDVPARYPDATAMLADLRRLHAKLSPLPARYVRLATWPGGRHVCEDQEQGSRVAVRLVNTPASLTEFAHRCNQLESLRCPQVEVPLRHFVNEQFVGIVSRVPEVADLHAQFGGQVLQSVENLQQLCEILAQVCDVLNVIHQAGQCHGFLSPYAVTVGPQGPQLHEVGNCPVLSARRHLGSAPESLESLGPLLPFWSPQMLAASHDPGPADDIYSVGAILYFLLTGQPPLEQEDRHRLMLGGSLAEPAYNPRAGNVLVPPRLAALVSKALRFNPHDRYATATEMAAALRAGRWPQDTVEALAQEALELFPPGAGPAALVQACERLALALQIDPGNPDAHLARGQIYLRDGSYRFAVEEFSKVVRICPSRDVFDWLGQCYERWEGQWARAVAAYEQALGFGDEPAILDRLARALRKLGRPRRAVHVLQRAIACESDESLRQRRLLILEQWHDGTAAGEPEDDALGAAVQVPKGSVPKRVDDQPADRHVGSATPIDGLPETIGGGENGFLSSS